MDNRKEPPFFNEDNVGPLYFKLPFYDTMELSIETLTGTCFELRVSPFEAVISVKGKIQRLEGIPACQQHLIWNNVELEDDYCLNDYNISEGCTLKLVLAMRGGPINTKKVPVGDPFRELAAYMDSTREEIWEKASCNKQVTFLVYREGDQLNFFRVVNRGDGTLTPLSESLRYVDLEKKPSRPLLSGIWVHSCDAVRSALVAQGSNRNGGSVYNFYTDEDEDAEPSPSGQQIIENSVTMNKMKLLRAKMENMNLSKKPKKVVKVKPQTPVAPRPCSGPAAVRQRVLRVLPHIGQSCLPSPPGCAHGPEPSRSVAAGPATPTAADRPPSSLGSEPLKEEASWEAAGSSHRPPPKTHADLPAKERAEPAPRPWWTKRSPGNSPPSEDTGPLPASDEGVPKDSPLPEVGGRASEPHAHGRGLRAAGLKHRRLSPLRAASASEEHPCGRTARFRGVKVDSPGKRPDVISKGEAREFTDVANKASREPVGCVASLRRSTRGSGRLWPSPPGVPGSPLQHAQDSGLGKGSPQAEHTAAFLLSSRGIGMNGNNAAAGKRVGESTHHLPPVKAPLQTKKKRTKHCFLCGQKTGLATSFECRQVGQLEKPTCFLCGDSACGNNFCASHRYAETHGCTYDYKNSGRRYLQEANPVVNAPKLPKI